MTDGGWALQKAMATTIGAVVSCPVYGHPPDNADLPFVRIGNDTVTPYDTKTSTGDDWFVTVEIYSADRGQQEAKELAGTVRNAIHRDKLTVTGFSVTMSRHEDTVIEQLPSGRAYLAIVRFRVVMEPTA